MQNARLPRSALFRIIFAPILAPLSLLYAFGLIIDRALKSRSAVWLSKPVISVGNITVGGTGKTPIVLRLISDLKFQALKPAVLTRGYAGFLQQSQAPDEPELIRSYFPDIAVAAGSDRVAAAERVEKENRPDIFILDDGFQHWPVKRLLDIVCIDATSPWGGRLLLPWGQLREPRGALQRAQLVVITRANAVRERNLEALERSIRALAPQAKLARASFVLDLVDTVGRKYSLREALAGKAVAAISGIGNPEPFEAALTQAGAQVTSFRFMDHHLYNERDLEPLQSWASLKNNALVTTEKDWVKLRKLSWGEKTPAPLYIARVSIQFDNDSQIQWDLALKSVRA